MRVATRWNRCASSLVIPRCRSWTWACVHARLETRSKIAGSRYLSARAIGAFAGVGRHQRKLHPCRGAGGEAEAATNAEDRIQDRADRIRQRPAILDRRSDDGSAAPPQEARAIRVVLQHADELAVHRHHVCRPDRLLAIARPAAGQQGLDLGDELGLDEEVRERRMSGIGRGGSENDLRIRSDVDLSGAQTRSSSAIFAAFPRRPPSKRRSAGSSRWSPSRRWISTRSSE